MQVLFVWTSKICCKRDIKVHDSVTHQPAQGPCHSAEKETQTWTEEQELFSSQRAQPLESGTKKENKQEKKQKNMQQICFSDNSANTSNLIFTPFRNHYPLVINYSVADSTPSNFTDARVSKFGPIPVHPLSLTTCFQIPPSDLTSPFKYLWPAEHKTIKLLSKHCCFAITSPPKMRGSVHDARQAFSRTKNSGLPSAYSKTAKLSHIIISNILFGFLF